MPCRAATARKRIDIVYGPHRTLFESLLVGEIQTNISVFFARQNRGPSPIEVPLHLEQLRAGAGNVGNVGEKEIRRHLLLDRQSGFGAAGDADQLRIDFYPAHAEEAL